MPLQHRRPDFVLQVEFENATTYFYAYRDQYGNLRQPSLHRHNVTGTDIYDSKGAMYFAVAVILIYGVSIALLIGTTLRRSNADYEVKGFLRSYARLDREKKTKEKMKMRRRLIEKNMLPVFPGCSLAAAPTIFEEGLQDTPGDESATENSPDTLIEIKSKINSSLGDDSPCSALDLLLGAGHLAYIDESPDNAITHSVIIEEDEDVDKASPSNTTMTSATATEQTSSPGPITVSQVTVHSYGIHEKAAHLGRDCEMT